MSATPKPDPSAFFCPYEECSAYGEVGQGNITLSHRYGHQGTYLLWCKRCQRTFSEHRGTPFFGLRTPREQILLALRCLAEGSGVSATARIVQTNEDTVRRWLDRVAQHTQWVTGYLVKELQLSQVQLDELWSYIKKKRSTSKKGIPKSMGSVGHGSVRIGTASFGSLPSVASGRRNKPRS
jgi:hypothetical protein